MARYFIIPYIEGTWMNSKGKLWFITRENGTKPRTIDVVAAIKAFTPGKSIRLIGLIEVTQQEYNSQYEL